MSKANEDQLSDLHGRFAQHLLGVLKGNPTAADLNVVRQFLKDNNITSEIGSNPVMSELEKSLPEVSDLDNMEIGSGHFN